MAIFGLFKKNKKGAPVKEELAVKEEIPTSATTEVTTNTAKKTTPKKQSAVKKDTVDSASNTKLTKNKTTSTKKAPVKTATAKADTIKKSATKATATKTEAVKEAPVKTAAAKADTTKKSASKVTAAKTVTPKNAATKQNTTAPTANVIIKKPYSNVVVKTTQITKIEKESVKGYTGKFEINKSKDGKKFFFNLYASNKVGIATSQMYSSAQSAMNGVKSVIANAESAPIEDQSLKKHESLPYPKWEIYVDNGGKYRFRLNASNGSCVCHSQGYTTKTACKNGIDSIIKSSRNAEIEKTYISKAEDK